MGEYCHRPSAPQSQDQGCGVRQAARVASGVFIAGPMPAPGPPESSSLALRSRREQKRLRQEAPFRLGTWDPTFCLPDLSMEASRAAGPGSVNLSPSDGGSLTPAGFQQEARGIFRPKLWVGPGSPGRGWEGPAWSPPQTPSLRRPG